MGGMFGNASEFVVFARRGSLRALGKVRATGSTGHVAEITAPSQTAFLDLVEQVIAGAEGLRCSLGELASAGDYWGDQSLETATLHKPAFDEEQA